MHEAFESFVVFKLSDLPLNRKILFIKFPELLLDLRLSAKGLLSVLILHLFF